VRYEIEAGGRTRQVVVTRVGAAFAVTMDQRTWNVDAARIDAHSLSLIVDDVLQGRRGLSSDVAVVADAATGQLTVHVGGTPVVVTVNGRRRWGRKDESGGSGAGPQRVTAPMPGKIVRVLVASGDVVAARQPLVVVEAMKMENELRAGRAGTVADVHAREGASVEAGALLLVIQ
jgi:biotin carboxyl carrier protein